MDRGRGIVGDSADILSARDSFLAGGHYSPIVDLIDRVLPPTPSLRLLDSGCGTGYYLREILARRDGWQALALDVSVDAVAIATRAAEMPGVVADVWQPLPVRSERADVVLCVFAPRNAEEFARVLPSGGMLVVVTPDASHLAELREAGLVIGIQTDKLAQLDATLESSFDLANRESLAYTVELDGDEVRSLAAMGPSGHHALGHDGAEREGAEPDHAEGAGAEGEPGGANRTSVTIAVDASVYRRR